MKITIIVNLFPPKWHAGTEIASYNLAKHLSRRGYEIHVITSHDGTLPDFRQENGFFIHQIAWPKIKIIGWLIYWIKIFQTIRKIKPLIVHAQDLDTGIPALFVKKILKIPYIVWGRGSDVYRPSLFGRITAKSIIQNADVSLALTENMRITLKKISNSEIIVIPNGIDLEEYYSETIKMERESSIKKILYVGRLHPVKGVQYLIMAMKIVHEKMPRSQLIIVGDGNEREILETLSIQSGIEKYVHFVGEVSHEKVHTYLQQADVFVLPSLSEGFPVVILEAMAYGLPIVATRVGGIPDIIKTGVHGFLVKEKRPDEIADKLLVLLQNDQLIMEISLNNKAEVKKYTWDNIVFKLEKIYLKISKDI